MIRIITPMALESAILSPKIKSRIPITKKIREFIIF
jgi:hypothetical protein